MNRAERRRAGQRGPKPPEPIQSIEQQLADHYQTSAETQRVVYGAACSWWDTIDKAGQIRGGGLPGCPFCGSPLFEIASETEWWDQIDAVEESGYRELIKWMRGKCFPDFTTARAEYKTSRS